MTGSRSPEVPPGYVRFRAGRAEVVALAPLAEAVRAAVTGGTLHGWAARHPQARALRGRDVAYAVPLDGGAARVVVRHARHGGALARLTGDRFLAPTRAPRELAIARRLTTAGVETPEVVAYALYPAGPLLRRSDVATREVAGRDLAEALCAPASAAERRAMLEATAALVRALGAAGARHHDLNLKNILLAPREAGAVRAVVLDVDRIVFGRPGDPAITAANLARLARSARKWRALHGAAIGEAELAMLTEAVR